MKERILVLDGAMGTMIQRYNLTEADFRNDVDIPGHIKVAGCNDLLCISRPDVIREIHRAYIDAGADIIETNSFNSNVLSMEEYGLQDRIDLLNRSAVKVAREAIAEYSVSSENPRKILIAGSMGPSNVALSLPEVAGARGVDFDVMRKAYCEQATALIDEGVNLLLLETIFDTLNAKAAIAGIEDAFDALQKRVPLMISVTIDERGRTLSGQTLRGFLASISHARPFSVGLNCGFGAREMAPWIDTIQDVGCRVSMHPNAGLPDEMGNYAETPESMAEAVKPLLEAGKLDIIGGCCGTTPDHIRAVAEVAAQCDARSEDAGDCIEPRPDVMRLSGFEDLEVSADNGFLKVGERCNVAGSRKFLRLVNEGNLSEAVEIAAGQISKGAKVLDINMDDAMLDAPAEMERFVSLLGADATVSPAPIMVDSSDFEVIVRALKRIQGRPIVNSISLKEGEAKFLEKARAIHRLGAAVVVMAFDEEGQATTFERRKEICSRAYRLLIDKVGFRGADIVFDPNILTIATGMPEHDRYALDFLDAVSWIKKNLPGAKVSGGVSNLSFSFRGNNKLREAMHAVFLDHAIRRGMDMAIVNPSTAISSEGIDPELVEAIEDVFFMRRPDATERLLDIAAEMKAEADRIKAAKAGLPKSAPAPAKEPTLEDLVEKGMTAGLEPLLDKALAEDGSAMVVVSKRLMGAMQKVGDEFGAGRMFLPQVVRSAAVMRSAIDYLTPVIESETSADNAEAGGKGTFIIATVKGDVHDIGKNIVGVILKCAGFEVIDLGVMVEATKIIETLRSTGSKYLGLSGLITPSLSEMANVAAMLEKEGLTDVTLFVGGATTSALHTAVKIAPLFSGLTVHTRDAAALPPIVSKLSSPTESIVAAKDIRNAQNKLREEYNAEKERKSVVVTPNAKEVGEFHKVATPVAAPLKTGVETYTMGVDEVSPLVNWKAFLNTWKLHPSLAGRAIEILDNGMPADVEGDLKEAVRLISDARELIEEMSSSNVTIAARSGVLSAHRDGDDIVIESADKKIVLPTLRRETAPMIAMADFLAEKDDYVGVFAVSVPKYTPAVSDEYKELLIKSVSDRLVEAATDLLHTKIHSEVWNLATPRSVRPAIGYPSLPDQSLVFLTDELIDYASIGVTLTENGALSPSSTTTGLIFGAPDARYFEVGHVSQTTIADYAKRRNLPLDRILSLLPSISK